MRPASLLLTLCTVLAAPSARGNTGRLVRTSLDDSPAQLAPPNSARLIRSTLDDASPRELAPEVTAVRLIRVSLDAPNAYAPLPSAERSERTLRTSLD